MVNCQCRRALLVAGFPPQHSVVKNPCWHFHAAHVKATTKGCAQPTNDRRTYFRLLSCPVFICIFALDRSQQQHRHRHHRAAAALPLNRHLPTNQQQQQRQQRRRHFGGRQQHQHRVQPRQQPRPFVVGRVQMGELEQSVIHQLLVRLHPFRKFIWALCALAAMLAILIILNSVWIIASTTTMHPVGDTSFVIFSEVLAWLLLILSGVGLKMTCMANSAAKAASSSSLTRLDEESASSALPLSLLELDQRNRPFSAPNWVPAAGWPADFGDLLPGAVRADQQPPFDPFLFPPPPPRYSSLELPAPVMVISAAEGSEAAAAGRRISQPITSRPSGSGGRGGGSFVRSPPPPYCPPPPPSRPADD